MSGPVGDLAYLDHAASTPMRADAVAAMLPYLSERFANPSGSHRASRAARRVIDEARDAVADALGVTAGEIVFTAGGTESDNAAIVGAVRARGGVAVCPAAEHHAVLHTVERCGGIVVPAGPTGAVDIDALRDALARTPDVAVVSVMAVNNEVGTITDLASVAAIARQHAPRALLHTDAVQAACWLDLRPIVALADLVSLSSHKFGGPKGAGVLVIRSGVTIDPLIVGGGQERERRSGTHNVPGIVATAVALSGTVAEREAEVARIGALRERLVSRVTSAVPDVVETVPGDHSVAGIAHLCFAGVESEALLYLLDEEGVCASAASACSAGALESSHVLSAMGVDPAWSRGALRLSMGHTTTTDDVDRAAEAIGRAVSRLRRAA